MSSFLVGWWDSVLVRQWDSEGGCRLSAVSFSQEGAPWSGEDRPLPGKGAAERQLY